MTIKEALSYGESLLLTVLKSDMPGLKEEELKRETTSNVLFLLSGLMGLSINQIKENPSIKMDDKQLEKYNSWLERRLNFEPVQYIVGEAEFYSLSFYVGNGVLIPRQDTESLVGEIENQLKDKKKTYNFLDICCGCGCIGISLLSIFPNSTVCFIDKEELALEYTKRNLKRHALEHRAKVLASDMFSILSSDTKFDCIVSNPPYIKDEDIRSLAMQISLFEPNTALSGGKTGLKFYELFALKAKDFLKAKAPLFLEIGYNQAKDVKAIFKSMGWKKTKIFNDLSGNPRIFLSFND